jgi:shikimate dehydrogenase
VKVPFAEVIGDPIAQSKSPLIHKHWLRLLDIESDYLRSRVERGDLQAFLDGRRADPDWRGCNVTVPHKEAILPLLDEVDESARVVGAVNCVVPRHGRLIGFNTDVDGVAAALDGTEFEGRDAILIGAGGAARAAVAYLAGRNVGSITMIARDPKKAESLRGLSPRAAFQFLSLDDEEAPRDPSAIINASPLGMVGSPEMPDRLLATVVARAGGATIFDMVYNPLKTAFLTSGGEAGGNPVDGLTMLIGQAERAFDLFFDQPPPPPPASAVRDLLAT